MKEAKKTLIRLMIGIWIVDLILLLAGIFIVERPLAYFLGVFVGMLTSTGLSYHMYHSLDIQLELDEKTAVRFARRDSFVRSMVVIAAIVGAVFLKKWINPYILLVSLFAMKISVFMQPLLERVMREDKERS